MNHPYLEGLAVWADQKPDQIALFDAAGSLTYSELYNRVQDLAAKVQNFREQNSITGFLPIFVDRDLESACLALTCLVYGIPFTPLDIEWTKERVQYAFDQLGSPSGALASQSSLSLVSQILPSGVVLEFSGSKNWDLLNSTIAKYIDEVADQDEVLVIFTSGTTGTPKGVVYEKEVLEKKFDSTNQLGNSRELTEAPLSETISTVCFPFHFVGGLYRLFDLTQGASLYICSVAELSLEQFLPLIQSLKVNSLSLPPALAILMASQATKYDHVQLTSVKQIRWGGDSISYDTLQALKPFFGPDTIARNGYGGSESLTWTTFEFPLHESPSSGPIPIAKYSQDSKFRLDPLEGNSERFVILLPAPTAKGYLNNPRLTSERFVFDAQGQGWWNTGDVVRVQKDGLIYHDSRIDDLVKIRGKLVSPSEAKQALLAMKDVDDAVVLPVEAHKDKQLVAHIQLAPGSTLTPSEIRKGLEKVLPTYLIPSRFMRHQAIPKNSRGKPDRNKLYDLDFVDFLSRPIKGPVTQTERSIHRVARTITSNPILSIDDDLWEHGLDSLAALEMEATLSHFFPQVTVDLLAEQRSIERIALKLDKSAAQDKSTSVLFNSESESGTVYGFPGIGNLGTHYSVLSGLLINKPKVVVYKYQRGSFEKEEISIDGKAKAITSQIMGEVKGSEPINLMGYSAGGALAYQVAQSLSAMGRQVRLAILDTPIQLLTDKTRLSSGKALSKPEIPVGLDVLRATINDFNAGMKRQGLRRGLKVALIERPLKLLISRKPSRRTLLNLAKLFSPVIPMDVRVLITDLVISRSLKEFKAKPFEKENSANIEVTYVYVQGNNSLDYWPELIPGISFVFASGNHMSMLTHPHVRSLADKLSSFFN